MDPGELPLDSLPEWDRSLRDELTGILCVRVSRTWKPSDYAENEDSRDLGVAVSKVTVSE